MIFNIFKNSFFLLQQENILKMWIKKYMRFIFNIWNSIYELNFNNKINFNDSFWQTLYLQNNLIILKILPMKNLLFLSISTIFLFYFLASGIHCAAVPPTWVAHPDIKTGTVLIITTSWVAGNATLSNTGSYSSAFTAVPGFGFGILSYYGEDNLYSEMFDITCSPGTSSFTITTKIMDYTKLSRLHIRYIAVSPTFPYHINVFHDVPINYAAGALNIITTPSLFPTIYQNTINYTNQANAIGSTFNTFTLPLTNSQIIIYLTSLSYTRPFSNGTIPTYISIYGQATSTDTYKIAISLIKNATISEVKLSIIIVDQVNVNSSNIYNAVIGEICIRDQTGIYQFPQALLSNFIIGITHLVVDYSTVSLTFSGSFTTTNNIYGANIDPKNQPSMSSMGACFSVFYLQYWYCPGNFTYDPITKMCIGCDSIQGCYTCTSTSVCTSCNTGSNYFLNGSNQCQSCSLSNCHHCSSLNTCSSCNNPYVLNLNNTCQLCALIGCLTCTNTYTCQVCNSNANYILVNGTCNLCSLGLFANASSNACENCAVQNCLTCLSLTSCQTCNYNASYGLTAFGNCSLCNSTANLFINLTSLACLPCTLSNCITCSSLTTCLLCNQALGYTLNQTTNLCDLCTIPGCLNCNNTLVCDICNSSANYILVNGTCNLCSLGLFANASSNACENCAVQNCLTCLSLTSCQTCNYNASYGLTAFGNCSLCNSTANLFINLTSLACLPCTLSNCITCSSLSTCSLCNNTNNYFLNISTSICQNCNLFQCLLCSNFTACSICNQSNNYFINTSDFNCQLCSVLNCSFCLNLTFCNYCNYGFYLSNQTGQCFSCNVLVGCLDCSSQNQCIVCDYNNSYFLNNSIGLCYKAQICGDGLITINQQCDDSNSNSFDGCSSSCQTQAFYSCTGSPSACSPTNFIQTYFSSIQKTQCNSFKVSILLSNFNLNQIKNSFYIMNSGIKITQVIDNDKYIQVCASYSKDIAGENILIQFSPGTLLNITYTPEIPALYYSAQECSTPGKIKNLIQSVQIISYILLIASLLSCKIVGLQLFGILQLSFFTLASQQFLNIYLQPLSNFKTLNGLNIGISSQTTKVPENFSKLAFTSLFVNNCNVMLFVMVGQLLLGAGIYFLSKPIQSQKMQKIGKILMKQGFITLVLFNIFNISFSAGVHWKYSDPSDQGYILSSFMLYGTILLLISAVFAMELTDPTEYGQFKSKFKAGPCRLHIPLTVVYRAVLGGYIAVEADYSFSTLIIIGFSLAFLMFNITNLPFLDTYQNYRCTFIHISMITILLVSNYYEVMKANTPISEKGRMYNAAILQLILIVVCVLISAVCLCYEIYLTIKKCMKNRKAIQIAQRPPKKQNEITEQSFEAL